MPDLTGCCLLGVEFFVDEGGDFVGHRAGQSRTEFIPFSYVGGSETG
ncbi:MAG: hypothetical protein ACI9VS_004329 [Candidatus Binatia bacterium]|jgi:hypothetical protein